MTTATQNQIPDPALKLGFAGLIPFVAAALMCVFTDAGAQNKFAFALCAYGAVILSFLGGVKWGAVLRNEEALKHWQPLGLSVAPSIVAWVALLLPAVAALLLLAIGLVGQYAIDSKSATAGEIPQWYSKLRLMLTTGATLSVFVGFLALVIR